MKRDESRTIYDTYGIPWSRALTPRHATVGETCHTRWCDGNTGAAADPGCSGGENTILCLSFSHPPPGGPRPLTHAHASCVARLSPSRDSRDSLCSVVCWWQRWFGNKKAPWEPKNSDWSCRAVDSVWGFGRLVFKQSWRHLFENDRLPNCPKRKGRVLRWLMSFKLSFCQSFFKKKKKKKGVVIKFFF